jgi:modulator of FtsH protease
VIGAESWANFYVMVGGASAALTGLILVAVSLHLRAILGHPLYRDRAMASLQGLVTALIVSGAVLMPQPLAALGVELGVIGLLWLARYVFFVRLFRRVTPGRRSALRTSEWPLWLVWIFAFIATGALLVAGDTRGFYVLAACVGIGLTLVVWNAWVLLAEVSG